MVTTNPPHPEIHAEDPSNGWEAVATHLITRRDAHIGVATLREWAATLPFGSSVLDLGCGHGFPLSTTLAASGFEVYGIDASPTLVEEFRRRLPGTPVRCEAVQTSTFFERRFDAVIAVGLLFLLSPSEQEQLIHCVARGLNPQGRFLFTAPVQNAIWTDMLTGRESRSLGVQRYTRILRDAGLEPLEGFTDEGENHYYSARAATG